MEATKLQKPLVGVGVIIIRNDFLLMTKRKGSHAEGTYGSVGGHMEFGESPIDTAKREALEELGIIIDNVELVSCLNMVKYDKHYIDLTFKAEIVSGEPEVREPHKIESVDWHDLNNLPDPVFEPVRIALRAMETGQVFHEVRE